MSNSQTSPQQSSQEDFAAFGLDSFAYVKPVQLQGRTAEGKDASMPAFAICSADGTQLAVAASHDAAVAAVRQHRLEPLSLH